MLNFCNFGFEFDFEKTKIEVLNFTLKFATRARLKFFIAKKDKFGQKTLFTLIYNCGVLCL
jgi:hypothetical protein